MGQPLLVGLGTWELVWSWSVQKYGPSLRRKKKKKAFSFLSEKLNLWKALLSLPLAP